MKHNTVQKKFQHKRRFKGGTNKFVAERRERNAMKIMIATKMKSIPTSKPLEEFPQRIVLITDKNYASIFNKWQKALQTIGIDTVYIDARRRFINDKFVQDAFKIEPSQLLALYYDPGDRTGNVRMFTRKINTTPDIPWGLIRGSSLYRVSNIKLETAALQRMNRYSNPTKSYASKPHIPAYSRITHMNRTFDNKTPLVLCGTECLLGINPQSMFIGQPQEFRESFDTNKKPNNDWTHYHTKHSTER